MDILIVERLYKEKYNTLYSFEYFIDLIVKGLTLIKSEALNRRANIIEQKAMRLALEYNFLATRSI